MNGSPLRFWFSRIRASKINNAAAIYSPSPNIDANPFSKDSTHYVLRIYKNRLALKYFKTADMQ